MINQENDFIHLACPRCGAGIEMTGDILTCAYCGAKLILKHSSARHHTQSGSRQPASPVVDGFPLNPYSYHDPQSGVEAFSLLVPTGWKMEGGVTWIPQRPAAPAEVRVRLANPEALEAFEILPTLYFTWTNNPMVQMTKPPGSLYFGYEVRQPMPALEVMRHFVLPRFRMLPDLTVVDAGPAAELLQVAVNAQATSTQGGQYSADAARLRLHYTIDQKPVAEEISGVAEYTHVIMPGMFGNNESVFWSMGYLTAFRASRETLENYGGLYRAIFTSIRINPAWRAIVQQVIQGLTSNTIRSIQQIGALSRQISRNYQEISDMNLKGWQERSAAYDRISENFSQTIRGVDPYYDPNAGRNVELPAGYVQAWSTPLGEYILSDDPNFNPNIGSNQTWTPLTPAEK